MQHEYMYFLGLPIELQSACPSRTLRRHQLQPQRTVFSVPDFYAPRSVKYPDGGTTRAVLWRFITGPLGAVGRRAGKNRTEIEMSTF